MTMTAAPALPAAERRGRVVRWLCADPVRAVAVALILAQLAWRPLVALRGFLAFDDFTLASRAAESGPGLGYLTTLFNNHLMPGALLVTWVVTRAAGLAYWPCVVLLTAGQAAASIAFYRLLRRMLRPGWGLLIPLVVFLFSPLTLEATSWWAVGLNLVPMELAMVLAIGAQVRFVQTGRARHLASLAAAMLLGLLFFEKSLLIAPLLVLLTVCLYTPGGPLRAVPRAARRYWRSWLVLGAVCGGGLWLYLSRARSSLHRPASAGEAFTFVRDMLGSTLVPGLLSGPWRWLPAGDGGPLAAPGGVLRWFALAAFAALVAGTSLVRPGAARAWLVLAGYVALVAALLGGTRLGYAFSPAAGLATRYVGDVVVVAALCTGVAVVGLREPPGEPAGGATRVPYPGRPAARPVLAGAVVAALTGYLLGAGYSGARFGDAWSVKQGRDYLRAARATLARMPPGRVLLDRAVPEDVQSSLTYPYNMQSRFFRPLRHRPVFVTEAESPWMIDDRGQLRRVAVQGVAIRPSAESPCGYVVRDGLTVRMPLGKEVYEWLWTVRVGYLASGDSVALLRLGDATHWFQIHRGLNQIIFLMLGVGDTVELTVQDPGVSLCTNDLTVGQPVPGP
jgi:hypothetical protein